MSVTARVRNYINFTGDLENETILDSGDLLNSPATQELVSLAIGNNSVAVPDIEDFVVHGVVIVPPTLNEEEITLKGVNGDTGITLSATQANVIQFGATPPAAFVLNVAAEVVGLRLIWF